MSEKDTGTFIWDGNKMTLSCGCNWEWDSGHPLDIFTGECCEYHGKKMYGWVN